MLIFLMLLCGIAVVTYLVQFASFYADGSKFFEPVCSARLFEPIEEDGFIMNPVQPEMPAALI
jgi:hypothetical protein